MKIVLEGKEADEYLAAVKLYDLDIALSRFDKLNTYTVWREGSLYIDHVNMLTDCLRAYLEECAYLKAKERKEHENDVP